MVVEVVMDSAKLRGASLGAGKKKRPLIHISQVLAMFLPALGVLKFTLLEDVDERPNSLNLAVTWTV